MYEQYNTFEAEGPKVQKISLDSPYILVVAPTRQHYPVLSSILCSAIYYKCNCAKLVISISML